MNPERRRRRLSPLLDAPAGMLLVHEIYRSLQGESTQAGRPCVFVRLSVCDARCSWCDTPQAFREGEFLEPAEVIGRVMAFDCGMVELTGGEPLLQPGVVPLMTAFADRGLEVLIETSGAHDVSPVDPRVHIIMDLKCPDSGEAPGNLWRNLDVLKASDEIKFVIASADDFAWAAAVIRERRLHERFTVVLSPAWGLVQARELAAWLLESKLPVRMQVQMHKYIWGADALGV